MGAAVTKEEFNQIVEERKQKAEAIFEALETTICNLHGRWQDEKDHEDWADYAKAMKKAITGQGGTFVKARKRPFSLTYELEGATYQIFCNRREYGFKRLK